jgi:septal ring factor EnvC (AmiA/AmiB activator)
MSLTTRSVSITAGTGRHALTILAVVASLAIGFLAIRAAAAWVTAAAPLDESPLAVQTLQSRLADETARAATLEARLGALTAHADAVESALATAQSHLVSDAAHADDLSAQLATAQAKLAAVERSIRDANRARLTRLVTSPSTSGTGGGEHEGGGDD